MSPGCRFTTPGCIALLTACLMLAGCGSSSNKAPLPAKGSYKGATYTVKRGDTLYRIAHMSGSSVRQLARLNGISAPYIIHTGQTLRLSGAASSRTATAKKNNAKKTSTRKTVTASAVSTGKAAPPPVGQRCWQWPAKGKVVIPFSNAQGGNKGIDISGQRGEPVYAAGAGRVVYAGDQLRGYGNLVMIKHDESYITAYAHNQTLLVRDGQQVTKGQKIATMGSSGADSVRLHFQLRYKATAVDPARYLPATYGGTCR